jgi:hypothetical protein
MPASMAALYKDKAKGKTAGMGRQRAARWELNALVRTCAILQSVTQSRKGAKNGTMCNSAIGV